MSTPWLCAGDFNEIQTNDEKMGGALRSIKEIERFREVITDCAFNEMMITGSKFTCSRRGTSNLIRERLDRGFVTNSWLEMFPWSEERHLVASILDHVPFLFHISNMQQMKATFKRPFRFENMWVKEEECQRVISENWNGSAIRSFKELVDSVKRCGHHLAKWNRENFGNWEYQIKQKKVKVKELLMRVNSMADSRK